MNQQEDVFIERWSGKIGEFLRFSQTCDENVRKWDSDGAESYRKLLDKEYPCSFQNLEAVFLNLIGNEAEVWDDDLYPPRLLFLSALMLVRWSVLKTTTDDEAKEYSQWADALRYMGWWVECKDPDEEA